MSRNIIVGFDPGTTVGIAILSLEGKLLKLLSDKGLDKSSVIKIISSFGNPILIATDKSYIPKSVKELATSFGCKVFVPEKEMKRDEKDWITKEYKNIIKNDHERDALAAALKAWKKYKSEIASTREFLKKIGIEDKEIEDALRLFISKGIIKRSKKIEIRKEKKRKHERNQISKRLEELKSENEILLRLVERLKEELSVYKKLVLNFEKGKKERKSNCLEALKKMNSLLMNDFIPVIQVERLTLDNLEEIDRCLGLQDKIIYTNDVERLPNLNTYDILFVITDKQPNIQNLKFFIVNSADLSIKEKDGFKVIIRSEFEKILLRLNKWRIENLIKRHKKK